MERLKIRENNQTSCLFGDIYRNRRVLVTGHTGFKGSWLSHWLCRLGADVLGYALPPESQPNHFSLLENSSITSVLADIRDFSQLEKVWGEFQPEVVFHLAAQPLVRLSYENPLETLHTNILGTANILEICRQTQSVQAIVNITSDKCYENREWVWGYRENDPMGGYDPYSASKGCAELITASYRNSFFTRDSSKQMAVPLLASVRAGNVIGGGDWAKDRIVTDMMQGASKDHVFTIRNPQATRPWQHVLEPLSGYLLLGQRLLQGRQELASAWNFGPDSDESISVLDVVQSMQKHWSRIKYEVACNKENPHEANLLKLDCSKARQYLGWRGIWSCETTFEKTVEWYRQFYEHQQLLTTQQLDEYIHDARCYKAVWAE